ncbi:MAG TPA: DNA-directed RNA polymerase subunit omega [Candidatus Avamphibacillus intestinigallinarum]|nr:DNA-directed RNA polymerase subunit omega [Candidatus Avamphibacillus intestinigallinarum]
MLEPSIDALQKHIKSKYTLVTIAASRARDLRNDEETVLEEPKSHKFVGIALEEVDAGKLYVAK